MFRRLIDWLKGRPSPPADYDAAADEAWYSAKSAFLAEHLGPEHEMVMHALIPYAVGGNLDLYYFPDGIDGTAIATKELASGPAQSPSNAMYDQYELVMFTRESIALEDAKDESSPFGAVHANINAILNLIARYSSEATLNPHETCEFPEEMEQVGGKCLIFDAYTSPGDAGPDGLGLLLVMEIFRSEMEYAMQNGGSALLTLLKDHGHYPYSDLNRSPVV